MSIEEQDRYDLIQYRLTEAKDTQFDVELLISHDRLRAAVNRTYYSKFYALMALGLKQEFETSKHAQLIGWFNKKFIHEELIDPKFNKIITKAFNRRTKWDYDSYIEFDRDTVLEMYEEMKEFNLEIGRLVNQNV